MHEMRQGLPAAGQKLFLDQGQAIQGQAIAERPGQKNQHQNRKKVMILALREMCNSLSSMASFLHR
jgi:hypothetical protein